MAQIGCRCGAQISDTTDSIPAKARFVRDVDFLSIEDEIVTRCTGYLEAAVERRTEAWLREQGYGPEYIDLKLSHAEILSDIMTGRDMRSFHMFECPTCGRLIVEIERNGFAFYEPEEGRSVGAFSGEQRHQ